MSTLKTSLVLVLIILLAAFLRLYHLPVLPPGLNFDEAGNGVAALDILHGAPQLWWRIGGGKEPLWSYVLALATVLWGNSPFTLRLAAAWIGILTVAAVYPLTYRLFRATGRGQARFVAMLAMLGLAGSDWHLHFSRLGLRAILLPLLSTLAFYFFWRMLVSYQLSVASGQWSVVSGQWSVISHQWSAATGRRSLITAYRSLAGSAFFLALAIYAYLAARLLPLVPLLFFILVWLIRRFQPRSTQTRGSTPSALPALRFSLFAQWLAALALFLSPLVVYFLLNPGDFAARATTVSIFNPDWNQGDLPGAAWRTLAATLGTFVGLTGDANPLVNLPYRPALPWLLAPFFILGVLAGLYHLIRPVSPAPPLLRSRAPYLFLLCWWMIMLLPAVLAPEGAPHHLRLMGTIVPTYIFVAVGLATATNWLAKLPSLAPRSPRLALRLIYLLPVTCYLLVSLQTYPHYFIDWPNQTDFTLPFDLYAVRLADDIAQAPPDVAYVLPMDIRAGPEARHYTLDYLLADYPDRYTYLPVDERNAETILTRAAAGKRELRVVRWTQDKHREADAKEIVTYLLQTKARLLSQDSFPVYDVESYALPAKPDFQLPLIDRPIGATFDGLLGLDAAVVPSAASPGSWLPIAITLAPLAPMEIDYKASLRLVGPDGERVAQKDRVLLHNFHQGTSLWPPETVNEYYLLSVPPDVTPGNYTATIVFYRPDTQAPLVADGAVEVKLGQVRIG